MRKKRQAAIISASLGKGCYRHIQVPTDYSLEDLAYIILCAFDFDNDHAHAFFMDNKAWSDADCYYMAEVDEDEEYRHTCDYSLSQLALKDGAAFKFLFDFGDEWTFQCKVLRFKETTENRPVLVQGVGKAPEQYPDYEE